MKSPLPLLLGALLLCVQATYANQTAPSDKTRQATNASVVIEAGGTGPHKSIATEEPSLPGMTLLRPDALQTEFAYEAIVEIGAPVQVGKTPAGHRQYIPITGGTFRGEKIQGIVLPGGADWQTSRTDGVTEVNALYSMKADDGTVIIVHNSGMIHGDAGFYARTATRFDVPEGPHAWLTRSQFVGTVSGGPRPGTVTIRIFRLR